jgi:hypothetical protein
VPDIEFMLRGAPPDARLWFPLVKAAFADGFAIRPTFLHPDCYALATAESCCARGGRPVFGACQHCLPEASPAGSKSVGRAVCVLMYNSTSRAGPRLVPGGLQAFVKTRPDLAIRSWGVLRAPALQANVIGPQARETT